MCGASLGNWTAGPADSGPWRAVSRLFAVIALLLAGTTAGLAQTLPGLASGTDTGSEDRPAEAGPPDPADLEALARLLGDERIRQWIAAQAQAEVETEAEADLFHNPLQDGLVRVRQKIQDIRGGITAFPDESRRALSIWGLEMGEGGTLRAVVYSLIFLAVGIAAELALWQATAGLRRRVVDAPRTGFGDRLQLTGLRILFSVMAVGAFALGSLGTFLAFDWQPITELFILTLLYAFVLVRLAGILSRLVLAPAAPNLRLVRVSDSAARFLHRWVIAIAAVAAFGFLTCTAIYRMGLLRTSHVLLISAVGLVLAAMVVGVIWLSRRDVRGLIAGPHAHLRGESGAGRIRSVLADLWPFVATGTIIVVWALWTIGAVRLMWTILILTATPLVFLAAHGLVRAAARPAVPEGADPPPTPHYLPVIHRFVRVLLVLVIVAALAHVQGVNLLTLVHSMAPVPRVVRAVFSVGMTILVADFIWQLIRAGIDRRLADAGGAPDPHALAADGEGGAAADPHARVRTLLPLVRKTIAVVLSVMVGMILLSSIGVNIGPLLAGAGVVGIAVGFGAQALVRDIVSGVFFLIDDAFRLGEYIEIGELRGTVEGISIRSLKLRHHRGAVHTIPFGEVRNMTNYSRDWVIMKLEFRVPFETDLALIKRIVKQIGKELLNDPTLGPAFIEPLKSQGVRRWEEFNMVVGVKFMAKPGQQFLIRKEAYQRIRDAFDANGIHFAQRQVTVQVAKDATPEEMEDAINAATHEFLDQNPKQPSAAE